MWAEASTSNPVTLSIAAGAPVSESVVLAPSTTVIGAVDQGTSPWIMGFPGGLGASSSAPFFVTCVGGCSGGGGGMVTVSNWPTTQPVSAAALPLPAGASTAALQPALNGDGGALAHITNWPATQPISAAALPLPAGASTAALQPALNGDGGALAHITNWPTIQAVSWTGQTVGATQSGIWTVQPGNTPNTTPWLVTGAGGTFPVTQVGAPWTINSTQWGGATLGAATAWGTAPSGNVQGVNANILTFPSGSIAGASPGAPNGGVIAPVSGDVTNPSSTLTLTSATTAYAAGQLIANNATGTGITVPSFSIANGAGAASIPRMRLISNDSTATAWGGVSVNVELWSASPTFGSSYGDRASYYPSGTTNWLATYNCSFNGIVNADGVAATCYPFGGAAPLIKLTSGATIYWTVYAASPSGVTGASKTLTLAPEIYN